MCLSEPTAALLCSARGVEPVTLSIALRTSLARRFGGQVKDASPLARASGGRAGDGDVRNVKAALDGAGRPRRELRPNRT